MTTIAEDYDSLLVNRLVQANFPVCDKYKYNEYNRICGANKPIGFMVGPNLRMNNLRGHTRHFSPRFSEIYSPPTSQNLFKIEYLWILIILTLLFIFLVI